PLNVLTHINARGNYAHVAGYDVSHDPAFQRLIDEIRKHGRTTYVLDKPDVLNWKSAVGLAGTQNGPHHELLLVLHPVNRGNDPMHAQGYTFSMLNLAQMTGRPSDPAFRPYVSMRVSAYEPDGMSAVLYQTKEEGVPRKA